MTRRRPPAHGARSSRVPVLRGLAIAVAVGAIGVGTWVLGSGPDERPVADESQVLTVPGVSGVPGVDTSGTAAVSKPPLSVAPAPPAAASSKRDSVTRATRKDRAADAKAPHSAKP